MQCLAIIIHHLYSTLILLFVLLLLHCCRYLWVSDTHLWDNNQFSCRIFQPTPSRLSTLRRRRWALYGGSLSWNLLVNGAWWAWKKNTSRNRQTFIKISDVEGEISFSFHAFNKHKRMGIFFSFLLLISLHHSFSIYDHHDVWISWWRIKKEKRGEEVKGYRSMLNTIYKIMTRLQTHPYNGVDEKRIR